MNSLVPIQNLIQISLEHGKHFPGQLDFKRGTDLLESEDLIRGEIKRDMFHVKH